VIAALIGIQLAKTLGPMKHVTMPAEIRIPKVVYKKNDGIKGKEDLICAETSLSLNWRRCLTGSPANADENASARFMTSQEWHSYVAPTLPLGEKY
jgi:hypothetical protein